MADFIAPDTVLMVREKTVTLGPRSRSLTPAETNAAVDRRAATYDRKRRSNLRARVREEGTTGQDTKKQESAAAMAQMRYISETPSRRAVFKDLWELQGRRPSPVEAADKYRQMSSHLSFALQDREQASRYREERKHRKGKIQLAPLVQKPSVSAVDAEKALREKAMADLKASQQSAVADLERRKRETNAELPTEVPAKISDQMDVFTYLSDDSDDDEPSAADMRALQFWSKRYENQQLVKKAFARSRQHKREAVQTMMRALPRGTSTSVDLPGQYVPLGTVTSFKLKRFS